MDGKRAADEHWERLLSTQPTITKELIEHMDDRFITAALHWDKLIHVNNTIAKELIERVDDRFVTAIGTSVVVVQSTRNDREL
ncbi:hypothetical protein Ae201684P_001118 [Aphanomyces euteiches]|nr:hypothetical protein Ae201684P_001118 [Aphanomyces euteiches]